MSVLEGLLFEDLELRPKTDIPKQDIEVLYALFPRKIGKGRAVLEIEKAIKRLLEGEAGKKFSYDTVIHGLVMKVQLYAQSPAGNRGSFTPHPATWFHQSRYLDDPKEWQHDDEKRTFSGQARLNTATAAQQYLANKRGDNRRASPEYGSPVDIQQGADDRGLSSLGRGNLNLLGSGD